MYYKVCVLLVALTSCGSHGQNVLPYELSSNTLQTGPPTGFEYNVVDSTTGDQKTRTEMRKGNAVTGMYSLVEPDGSIRVVKYTADENGFRATVSNEKASSVQGQRNPAPTALPTYSSVPAPVSQPAHNQFQTNTAYYTQNAAAPPQQYTHNVAPVQQYTQTPAPPVQQYTHTPAPTPTIQYSHNPPQTVYRHVPPIHPDFESVSSQAAQAYRPTSQPQYQSAPAPVTYNEPRKTTVQTFPGPAPSAPASPAYTSNDNNDYNNNIDDEGGNDGPVSYNYGYAVADRETGDQKSRSETRDGDNITGEYSVVDADGSLRTVKYRAGPKIGFQATVIRKEASTSGAGGSPAVQTQTFPAPAPASTSSTAGNEGTAPGAGPPAGAGGKVGRRRKVVKVIRYE